MNSGGRRRSSMRRPSAQDREQYYLRDLPAGTKVIACLPCTSRRTLLLTVQVQHDALGASSGGGVGVNHVNHDNDHHLGVDAIHPSGTSGLTSSGQSALSGGSGGGANGGPGGIHDNVSGGVGAGGDDDDAHTNLSTRFFNPQLRVYDGASKKDRKDRPLKELRYVDAVWEGNPAIVFELANSKKRFEFEVEAVPSSGLDMPSSDDVLSPPSSSIFARRSSMDRRSSTVVGAGTRLPARALMTRAQRANLDALNEFLWWLLQSADRFASTSPKTTLDMLSLRLKVAALVPGSGAAISANVAQKEVISAWRARRLAEEDPAPAAGQGVVPKMIASASMMSMAALPGAANIQTPLSHTTSLSSSAVPARFDSLRTSGSMASSIASAANIDPEGAEWENSLGLGAPIDDTKQQLLAFAAQMGVVDKDDIVELPSMTDGEARIVEDYLRGVCGLEVRSIDRLRSVLEDRLSEIEAANIRLLMEHLPVVQTVAFANASAQPSTPIAQPEGSKLTEEVVNDLESVMDTASGYGMWMKYNDARLQGMRSRVAQIEKKNRRLKLRQRNEERLAELLRNIIDRLQLSDADERRLRKPDFSDPASLLETERAATNLARAISCKLEYEELEELHAVKQQRAHNMQLRDKFCSAAVKFLETTFGRLVAEEERRSSASKSSSSSVFGGGRLEPLTAVHTGLVELEHLAELLRQLDKDALRQLRSTYSHQAARVMGERLKRFFASQRGVYAVESKDTRLNAFPEFVLGGGVSLARRRHRGSGNIGSTSADSLPGRRTRGGRRAPPPALLTESSTARAMKLQGKRLVHEAFGEALRTCLPVVIIEHYFVLSFFGFRRAAWEERRVALLKKRSELRRQFARNRLRERRQRRRLLAGNLLRYAEEDEEGFDDDFIFDDEPDRAEAAKSEFMMLSEIERALGQRGSVDDGDMQGRKARRARRRSSLGTTIPSTVREEDAALDTPARGSAFYSGPNSPRLSSADVSDDSEAMAAVMASAARDAERTIESDEDGADAHALPPLPFLPEEPPDEETMLEQLDKSWLKSYLEREKRLELSAEAGSRKKENKEKFQGADRIVARMFKGLGHHLCELADEGDRMDHFYTLNMLVEVEAASVQYGTSSNVVSRMLSDLTMHLYLAFNLFIDREAKWISTYKANPKRCGVLPPVAKFPSFVYRMQSVVSGRQSQVADSKFVNMASIIFSWLEGVAQQDDKYTDVVMMENCHYIYEIFTKGFPEPIPALKQHVQRCHLAFYTHLLRYVQWNVRYEMPELAQFWDHLDEQMDANSRDDIPFISGLSKHDLRALVTEFVNKRALNKSIANMLKRIQKHMPRNPKLVQSVWSHVHNYFLSRYELFEGVVQDCYPSEKLELTGHAITAIFSKQGVPIGFEDEIFEQVSSIQGIRERKKEMARLAQVSRLSTKSGYEESTLLLNELAAHHGDEDPVAAAQSSYASAAASQPGSRPTDSTAVSEGEPVPLSRNRSLSSSALTQALRGEANGDGDDADDDDDAEEDDDAVDDVVDGGSDADVDADIDKAPSRQASVVSTGTAASASSSATASPVQKRRWFQHRSADTPSALILGAKEGSGDLGRPRLSPSLRSAIIQGRRLNAVPTKPNEPAESTSPGATPAAAPTAAAPSNDDLLLAGDSTDSSDSGFVDFDED